MAEKDEKPAGSTGETNPDGTPKVVETPKGDEKPGDKKPRFSTEDQEYINSIVDEVFARGVKQGTTQLTTQLEEARTSITTLQTEIADLKKAGKKKTDEGGSDEKEKGKLAQLQAQLEELQTGYEAIKTERDQLKGTITSEQTKARSAQFESTFMDGVEESGITFFNARQVLKDVREELRHDEDGKLTVMNLKTGQPRHNHEMRPVELKDFLAEYARKNPHMVKTEVDGGTGGSESRRQETRTKQKSVKDMSQTEFEAFHRSVLSGNAKQ